MKIRHLSAFAFTLCVLTLAASSAPCAAKEPGLEKIWLLGKANGAYGEFSSSPAKVTMQGYDSAYEKGFEVKVSGANSRGDFPGLQAGPLAPWGKYREYPLNILFKLDAPSPGGYFLTLSLIGVSTGDAATLTVSAGDYQKILNPAAGFKEELLTMSQGYGTQQDITVFLPASALNSGVNDVTITLTAGEWVLYDYVRLEGITNPDELILKNFTAEVAPFLAHGESGPGHLVTVSFAASGAANSRITVTCGETSINKDVSIAPGQNSIDVIFPEVSAEQTCAVALETGGEKIDEAAVAIKPIRHYSITLVPHSHLDIGYPDLQPNIMIYQKQILETAVDMINNGDGEPMAWATEVTWPVLNLINDVSPYDVYGDWVDDVQLMKTLSKKFLTEVPYMRNVAPMAEVTSSRGVANDHNNRRAVDGSRMSWFSWGPAREAWITLKFDEPQKADYITIRAGKESQNPVTKMLLTYVDENGASFSREEGPMSPLREHYVIDAGGARIRELTFKFPDTEKPEFPLALMEIEVWANEPQDAFKENLRRAFKSRRLESSGLYLNFLTQLMPTEWLIRSMLRSREVADWSGVPFKTAMFTDVPGYSDFIPDLLAGSGIRYFYPSLNPDRARSCLEGIPNAFYWTGPAGGEVLVYRSINTYNEGWWLGFGQSVLTAEQKLPEFLEGLAQDNYPYDMIALRMLGDITDDGPVPEKLPRIVSDWNKKWAYPTLNIETPSKFFEAFEDKYSGVIPRLKGDWTAYWEDGAGSSALETAMMREVHNDFLFAAAFTAIQKLFTGKSSGHEAELATIEEETYLYDEHTWGADVSVWEPDSPFTQGQWRFKQMPITDAFSRIKKSTNMIAPMLGMLAPAPAHGGKILAVVNGADIRRTGLVSTPVDDSAEYEVYACATDEKIETATTVGPEGARLLFTVTDAPPIGVSFYEIVPISEKKPESAAAAPSGAILKNSFYKIEVNPETGRIESVYDKEAGRELVDSALGFGMNEYLYVELFNHETPVRMTNVSVAQGVSNRFYSELKISGSMESTPEIEQTVRLYNNAKLIEFENRINKNAVYSKEAGYFAFPFSVAGGKLLAEMTGGVMTLEDDQLPGGSRDWMSIQNAAAAVSDDFSIIFTTTDAPLIAPEGIRIGRYTKHLPGDSAALFSYAFNNYWHTNYRASQQGELTFRYSITSVPRRATASEIISAGKIATLPMKAVMTDGGAATDAGGSGALSFLSIMPSSVQIIGVKAPEDGDGLIVRLQEMDGLETEFTLRASASLGLGGAAFTNFLENEDSPALKTALDGGGDIIISEKIPPRGYLTIRLK